MTDAFGFKFGCVEVKLPVGDARVRQPSVYLRASLTKSVDDKTFINLNTKVNAIKTIVCVMASGAKSYELLANTNVVEQLSRLKQDKIKEIASQGCCVKRFRADNKQIRTNMLKVPDIITIHTPDVGGVTGIDIDVIRHRGLWIEMTSDNLTYVGKAIHAQFAAGGCGVKATSRGKKRSRGNVIADIPQSTADPTTEFSPDPSGVLDEANTSDEPDEHETQPEDKSDDSDGENDESAESSADTPSVPSNAHATVREPASASTPLRQTSLFELFNKAG